MSDLIFCDFIGGKYFCKKASVNSSHVVILPIARDCNQALALSLNENENNLKRMASWLTPGYFTVLHNSIKSEMCRFGSSLGSPANWVLCWIIWIIEDFNSKELA